MAHLLRAEVMLPPQPAVLRPLTFLVTRVLRAATIATMPRWMREMAGLRQPRTVDVAVTPVMKIAFWLVRLTPRGELALLKQLSPATVPVVAPILLGIAPLRHETLTPAQARERYGYPAPALAHLEWRAKQRAREDRPDQIAPSDEGLIESELRSWVRWRDRVGVRPMPLLHRARSSLPSAANNYLDAALHIADRDGRRRGCPSMRSRVN